MHVELIEDCIKIGLEPDEFVSRFSSQVHIGMDFFEEIAKLRAWRRMWARIMKEGKIKMNVLLEKEGKVARVILNRPEVLNALDMETRIELARVLRQLTEDEETRAVILTGAGRAFCAGGDVRGQGQIPVSRAQERLEKIYDCIHLLLEMPKPVIAEVNGTAAGVGCTLAFACDTIFASEKAKFSLAFSKVGLVPDGGCIFMLTKMLSLPLAKELVFTGKMIDAQEALKLGLINRVLPHDELQKVTMEFATELASGPTKAYGLAKQLFRQAQHVDLNTFLKAESFSQILCMHSDDHQEGVAAFLEKRQPKFTGK